MRRLFRRPALRKCARALYSYGSSATVEEIETIATGLAILRNHPIFASIDYFANTTTEQNFDRDGFTRILVNNGNDKKPIMSIELNPWQRASAGEWAYAIAHYQAYLFPVGGRLPFDTRAPIFHFGRSC